MKSKSITFSCPHCQEWQVAQMPQELPSDITFPCRMCQKHVSLTRLAFPAVTGCPVCGCKDLHQHKDFNKTLGLVIFLIGVALSFHTYHISLLIALVVDALLYPLFPFLSICYRCQAEMRGWNKNPELDRFNHEIAAHYQYGRK